MPRQAFMSKRQARQVGRRIRSVRRERGLSQRQIAGPGMSPAYISRLEAGDRNPSGHALQVLAGKLGTTALYLETGREDADCPHCARHPHPSPNDEPHDFDYSDYTCVCGRDRDDPIHTHMQKETRDA